MQHLLLGGLAEKAGRCSAGSWWPAGWDNKGVAAWCSHTRASCHLFQQEALCPPTNETHTVQPQLGHMQQLQQATAFILGVNFYGMHVVHVKGSSYVDSALL